MLDPETQARISQLEAKIASLESRLSEKLDKTELDSFTIKQGQRVSVSGTGRNISISADDQTGNGAAAAGDGSGGDDSFKEGYWKPFTDCDGDSFESWVREFTPP